MQSRTFRNFKFLDEMRLRVCFYTASLTCLKTRNHLSTLTWSVCRPPRTRKKLYAKKACLQDAITRKFDMLFLTTRDLQMPLLYCLSLALWKCSIRYAECGLSVRQSIRSHIEVQKNLAIKKKQQHVGISMGHFFCRFFPCDIECFSLFKLSELPLAKICEVAHRKYVFNLSSN